MWKQYALAGALFVAYVANDQLHLLGGTNPQTEVAGFTAGAEVQDKQGNRYTSTVTAREDGAYLIELTPIKPEPARSGM